jgi:hypothetical protein
LPFSFSVERRIIAAIAVFKRRLPPRSPLKAGLSVHVDNLRKYLLHVSGTLISGRESNPAVSWPMNIHPETTVPSGNPL